MSEVTKTTRTHGVALGLLLVLSCRLPEDRRLAGSAVACTTMGTIMPVLKCHFVAHGGYPASLGELAVATSSCPAVDRIKTAKEDGGAATLAYAGYTYHYTATSPASQGRFRHFTLLASGPYDTSECARCRSYWLDHSGVLRIGHGRTANAADRADDGTCRP